MIVPSAVIVGIVVVGGVGVVVVAVVEKSENGICFKHSIYFLVPYMMDQYNSLLKIQKFPHSCLFRIQDCQHIHHHCHNHPHLIRRDTKLCNMPM